MARPVTDPFSGQPALKNLAVSLERYDSAQYGFMVSKEKPDLTSVTYWALAKAQGGWRAEFALKEPITDIAGFADSILPNALAHEPMRYGDLENGDRRAAYFDGDQLAAALFIADTPVVASRAFLADCLSQNFTTGIERAEVIAARPPANRIDKGAIVCSCFGVGTNEIADAAARGCHSVEAIGKHLNAGTNCGSCKSEISELIRQNILIAAE